MTLPVSFLRKPLAHRGLHDREAGVIENSPTAFQRAIDAGFGIELDVQLSADQKAMVFHDYDMKRLAGLAGPIQQRASAELAEIALTDSTDTIHTLPEILELIDGKVPVLIEIKDQDGAMGPNIGRLEQAVADALADYKGHAAVMSFNPHCTATFRDMAPDIPCGLVTSAFDPDQWNLSLETCYRLRNIPDFDKVGAQFISHEAADLARDRIAEIRDAGFPVLCWTIRSEAQAKEALRYADNITFEGYLPA